MDFIRYAERVPELVNAQVEDESDLQALLKGRPWLAERITSRDVSGVRKLQRELRPLFETSDEKVVVEGLNTLLARHPVSPFISGHDAEDLHMHVAERMSSVADTLAAESLMGMAVLVCDLGPDRFGICDAQWCDNTYVDTSPNRSRRYCSERCSSRANVAKFRARRKAEASQTEASRATASKRRASSKGAR